MTFNFGIYPLSVVIQIFLTYIMDEEITVQVENRDCDDRFAGGQPCFEASASPAHSRES